jgi:hypothetical protein
MQFLDVGAVLFLVMQRLAELCRVQTGALPRQASLVAEDGVSE